MEGGAETPRYGLLPFLPAVVAGAHRGVLDVAFDVGALGFVAGADHVGGVIELGDVLQAFVFCIHREGTRLLGLAENGDREAIECTAGLGAVAAHGDVGQALLGVDIALAENGRLGVAHNVVGQADDGVLGFVDLAQVGLLLDRRGRWGGCGRVILQRSLLTVE